MSMAERQTRFTSPFQAGESHVGLGKLLRRKDKWILKVFPDSEGDADEALCGMFFRLARSAGGQCPARSDGDFVRRTFGDAVRSKELLRDAQAVMAAAVRKRARPATTRDARHGRREMRTALVAPAGDMAKRHAFPGLKAIARIKSKRGGEKTVTRYFLMTRSYRNDEVLRIVRQHWTIENGLHWPLDVILDEDLARSRKDNAPANLAVLRRLALNIARAHPDTKTSLRGKLKRAGWDETFLFEMLRHMR